MSGLTGISYKKESVWQYVENTVVRCARIWYGDFNFKIAFEQMKCCKRNNFNIGQTVVLAKLNYIYFTI